MSAMSERCRRCQRCRSDVGDVDDVVDVGAMSAIKFQSEHALWSKRRDCLPNTVYLYLTFHNNLLWGNMTPLKSSKVKFDCGRVLLKIQPKLKGGGYQPDPDFSHFCTVMSTTQSFRINHATIESVGWVLPKSAKKSKIHYDIIGGIPQKRLIKSMEKVVSKNLITQSNFGLCTWFFLLALKMHRKTK